MWSLATRAGSLPVFSENSHYAVNVLAVDQLDLCKRFATMKGDRFAGVPHTLLASGTPILDGALAWFECYNRSRYNEGDHVIFVGEVERCGVHEDGTDRMPLIFHAGGLHTPQSLG